MYRVLIVDDEPLVQVGLQSMVDWKDLGAQLLPCASNGQAAWEAIQTLQPDIVFTDIKMPLLDGLELIRRVQASDDQGPEFIILTSYEDFGFAREAAKHQVVDYLVKLEINPEAVAEAFEKARQRVDLRKAPRTGSLDLDAARRDRAFFGLINGNFRTEAAFHEALGDASAHWKAPWFVAVCCRLGARATVPFHYVVRMLKEILGRQYLVQELPYTPTEFVLLLACSETLRDAQTAQGRFLASLETSVSMANRYFNCALVAGLGPAVSSVVRMGESYEGARRALGRCTDEDALVSDSPSGGGPGPADCEAFRKNLEQAIETQDPGLLKDSFRVARDSLEATGSLATALDLATSALYAVTATVRDAEAHLARWFAAAPEGAKVLFAVPSTSHVAWWLAELEQGLANLVHEEWEPRDRVAESVRLYLDHHYREPLQLQGVAEHFRLSPNYAGILVRKATGKGFTEYVAELRVAKAKELLARKKWKIYEVAEQVGFENSYYFSKVFRRVTGMSPRDYRNAVENGESCH